MKTNVLVRFNIEGVHAWKGVKEDKELNEKVGFLAFPHRHQFYIEAERAVSHDDRDVEIIDLKRKMIAYLQGTYSQDGTNVCDFGQMSCEMIAKELLERFELEKCQVTEDNENGAVVYKQSGEIKPEVTEHKEQKPEDKFLFRDITFICGYPGSGKSTMRKALEYQLDDPLSIEVGSIVRIIKQDKNRVHDKSLDTQIVEKITEALEMSDSKNVIISGVRQVSILRAFTNANMIWIDSLPFVRFKRVRERNSEKDKDCTIKEFQELDDKEAELGLEQVRQFIYNRQNKEE